MKIFAIIVNLIIFPGVGTLIVKKWGQGIVQILLYLLAVGLVFTGILAIAGIVLGIGVWIWGIVSAVTAEVEPVSVTVQSDSPKE